MAQMSLKQGLKAFSGIAEDRALKEITQLQIMVTFPHMAH
jgi:hypothetical protein